jgi:hypothetical protein
VAGVVLHAPQREHGDSERELFVPMGATKLYEAGAAPVAGGLIQGAG